MPERETTDDGYRRGQRDMRHRAALAIVRTRDGATQAQRAALAEAAEAVLALNEAPDPVARRGVADE